FKWAVKLNRVSLNLFGLWPNPEENSKDKFVNNIRALFSFLMMIILLVPAIHSLIKIHSNIILTIANLQYTLSIITSVIRLSIFWWKKRALTSVVSMMVEDWLKPKATYEKNTMIKWALRARMIITCTYIIILMVLITILGMPIFEKLTRSNITDSSRSLALQTFYIYDVTKRPQYELTYISQCISLTIAGILYTGIDNFLGLLVFHVCGQFDIIKNHLKYSRKNFRAVLKSSVVYHMRLLRAINIIEDTYNIILLILFLYFGILFAFCGFLLITVLIGEENDITFTRLLNLVFVIASLFIHMALYCAFGEVLLAKCNEIHYAVYDCEWYSLNPKVAKDLLVFMIKVSKPVYFTAGKVFPVNMVMFSDLIKTSASYISVLLTMRIN
ncbi:OrU10, partial [Eciton burchellii]